MDTSAALVAGPASDQTVENRPVEDTALLRIEDLYRTLGEAAVRERVAKLRSLLVDGKHETEILRRTGWQPTELAALRSELVRQECEAWRRPAEVLYAEYVLQQERCLRNLEEMMRTWRKDPKAAPSVVAGVRASSEIIDRIVRQGQELGVLVRAAQRRQVIVAGMNVADLANQQLREVVVQQLTGLKQLVERIGDVDSLDGRVPTPVPVRGAAESTGSGETDGERVRRLAGTGFSKVRGARAQVRQRIRVTDAVEVGS